MPFHRSGRTPLHRSGRTSFHRSGRRAFHFREGRSGPADFGARLTLALLGVLLFSIPAIPAFASAETPPPGPAAPAGDALLYSLPPSSRAAARELGLPGDHDRVDGRMVFELAGEQVRSLQARGVDVQPLLPSTEEARLRLGEAPSPDAFHTYDEIRAGLYAAAAAHPSIARIEVLGLSIQGREIVGLKISDAVEQDEDEPELAFFGEIHGNEYAAGEMPYLYALYLCDNYGTDPTVTAMVDGNEIWCIPVLNPDGRVNARRTNMNGIDLNRDLGYQWNGEGGSPAPFSQIETRALEAFCRARPLTLALTFHCSGDIVFYPWGYWPHDVPDIDETAALAYGYSMAAAYAFGNSWADYETHGELLDQVYGTRGAICLTVEISNTSSLLPQTFARNQAGMTWLIQQAGAGVHGIVTDAATGLPLAATVRLAGNAIPSTSDPLAGAVHRVIPPGTYDLTLWADGYQPAAVAGVIVTETSPGEFQASLQPGEGEHAVAVVAADQRDPNNRYVQATWPSAALGIPDGAPASLGASGFIVIDLGAGHEAVDGPGNDFTVTEALFTADPAPESYVVHAGNAYTQTVLVGSGSGTASFDLAASGLASARYLRITDQSGASPDLPYAGMDFDGISLLNGASVSVEEIDEEGGPGDPAAGGPRAGGSHEDSGSGLIAAGLFPNPAGSSAYLALQLTRPERITLTLFDCLGRNAGRVVQIVPPGSWSLPVRRPPAGPGLYLYRIDAGPESRTGRLVFLP